MRKPPTLGGLSHWKAVNTAGIGRSLPKADDGPGHLGPAQHLTVPRRIPTPNQSRATLLGTLGPENPQQRHPQPRPAPRHRLNQVPLDSRQFPAESQPRISPGRRCWALPDPKTPNNVTLNRDPPQRVSRGATRALNPAFMPPGRRNATASSR
jgi:hypothetical protein